MAGCLKNTSNSRWQFTGSKTLSLSLCPSSSLSLSQTLADRESSDRADSDLEGPPLEWHLL